MTEQRRPIWRQAFDAAERQVSPRLDELYRSEEFAVAIALASQATGAVSARVQREAHRYRRALNQPSATDMQRLAAEMRAVRVELRDLRDAVARMSEDRTDG